MNAARKAKKQGSGILNRYLENNAAADRFALLQLGFIPWAASGLSGWQYAKNPAQAQPCAEKNAQAPNHQAGEGIQGRSR
jgi:hypothetical protein